MSVNKLMLEAEGMSFPLEETECGLSEKLKTEFLDRTVLGDFKDPVRTKLTKKQLPMVYAFIKSLKAKEAVVDLTEGAEVSIARTVSSFQKLVSDLTLQSEDFSRLLEFQNEFKVKHLTENIAFFVFLQTRDKSTPEDVAAALGLTHDWNQVPASTQEKVRSLIVSSR